MLQMFIEFDWLLALRTYLWQGTAIAVLAWAFTKFWPGTNAATRYSIWSIALVAMFLLPVAWVVPIGSERIAETAQTQATHQTVHVQTIVLKQRDFSSEMLPQASLAAVKENHQQLSFQPRVTPSDASAASLKQHVVLEQIVPPSQQQPHHFEEAAWYQNPRHWSMAFALLWLLGGILFCGHIGIDLIKLRILKGRVRSMRGPLASWFAEQAGSMDIDRPVVLAGSHAVASPMAIGFIRPHVLIPEYLWVHLDGDALKQVLAHELAHIRRNDDWHHLFQRLIMAVLFWHPAAWFVFKRLAFERELACDDWAVRDGKAKKYARSLVRVYERLGHIPVNAGALGAAKFRSQLGRRVEHLTDQRYQRGVQVAHLPLLLAMLALFGSAAVLATQAPGPKLAWSLWGMLNPQTEQTETSEKLETQLQESRRRVRALIQESEELLSERRQEMLALSQEKAQLNSEMRERLKEIEVRQAELNERRQEQNQKSLQEAIQQAAEQQLANVEQRSRHAQEQQVIKASRLQDVANQAYAEASLRATERDELEQAKVKANQTAKAAAKAEKSSKEEQRRQLQNLEEKLEEKRRQLQNYEAELKRAEEQLKALEHKARKKVRVTTRGEEKEFRVFVIDSDDQEIQLDEQYEVFLNSDDPMEEISKSALLLKLADGTLTPEPPPKVMVLKADPGAMVDLEGLREQFPDHVVQAVPPLAPNAVVRLEDLSDRVFHLSTSDLPDVHHLEVKDDHIFSSKSKTRTLTIDDDNILFKLAGNVRFNQAGDGIQHLGLGSKLQLKGKFEGRELHVSMQGSIAGTPEITLYIDGKKAPYEPEGKAFLEFHLPKLALYDAHYRQQRIETLLDENGPQAVIDLLDQFEFGTYLQSHIVLELLSTRKLEPFHIDQIMERSESWQASHHRFQLYSAIVRASPEYELERWVPLLFTDLGSYDSAKLVQIICSTQKNLTTALAENLLMAIQAIDSDYDRARSLAALVNKAPNFNTLRDAGFLNAALAIESNHEQAKLWHKIMLQYGQTIAPDLSQALAHMESSFEITRLLETWINLSNIPLEPVWTTLANMNSNYDKAKVLNQLARKKKLNQAALLQFLDATENIDSQYDRAKVLKQLERNHILKGEALDQYHQLLGSVSEAQ